MSEANWPIRVGGEYEPQDRSSNYFARITEIDGEAIHTHILTKAERLDVGPSEYRSNTFRRIFAPEDASPLPRMYALLEKLLQEYDRGELHYHAMMPSSESMDEARALLAERDANAAH